MSDALTRDPHSRATCEARDRDDPLAPLRQQFQIAPDTVYLDGNSLGALPVATATKLQEVVVREWGQGLIGSWNKAGWIDQPRRVGDKIARLVGADAGEVVATDTTSLNLYKVLDVALSLARDDSPGRRVIVSERDNFPTDLYIAESLARKHDCELRLVDGPDRVLEALDASVAVLMLTHVNYRTGRMHPMAEMTAAAHANGTLVIWDLAHSAGAVPLALRACDADFAVGCGYKYMNGGPGAPAFVWVHSRHLERMDAQQRWQPLAGWMGHAAPFEFTPHYQPANGIARFTCGTPSPLAMAALECGVDTLLAAQPLGGMDALRRKSLALADLFIELVDQRCAGHGLALQTPRDAVLRGSQVSFLREEGGYAIVQALIARGVVGDYREPGILRFGLTPLTLRFVDVWDAVEHLSQVLETREWKQARFQSRASVT